MSCKSGEAGRRLSRAVLYRELNREATRGLGLSVVLLLCTSGLAVSLLGGRLLPDYSLALRLSLAILPATLAFTVARWLFVASPVPAGIALAPDEALRFRRVVGRLCEQLRVPVLDRLLISNDLNAAVITRPRHGLWGAMESVLVVGLPLLQSVNPRQLQAILAHEIAHLGRQRAGEKAWDAHFRAWWLRVVDRIDNCPDIISRLVSIPLRPLSDRFVLSLLELSHLEEFEADAVAADMVGAEALAEALIEVALKAQILHAEVVLADPALGATADAAGSWGLLASGSRGTLRELRGALCTAELLDEPGAALHPALGDRLAALQVGLHSLIDEAPSALFPQSAAVPATAFRPRRAAGSRLRGPSWLAARSCSPPLRGRPGSHTFRCCARSLWCPPRGWRRVDP